MITTRKNILSIERYQPGKPIQEVQREYGLTTIIKLASNENPWGPSPKVVRAITDGLSGISRYPEGTCHNLRLALSRRWGISPQKIIFGNGSNELLVMIGMAFLGKGDEVVYSEESFVVYSMIAALTGAHPLVAPAKNHAHNLKEMSDRITRRTKVVFICNPNNPTGTIITKSDLKSFVADIPEQCLLVLDEAYAEYVADRNYGQGLPFVRKNGHIMFLRTFSKAYGLAGLRVGYGIAQKSVIDVLERVRQPFNVNSVAQWAALAALKDRKYLLKVIHSNRIERRYLQGQLKSLNIKIVPSEANFIFIKSSIPAQCLFEKLLKRGVIVRPIGSDYVRITVGSHSENCSLIKKIIL